MLFFVGKLFNSFRCPIISSEQLSSFSEVSDIFAISFYSPLHISSPSAFPARSLLGKTRKNERLPTKSARLQCGLRSFLAEAQAAPHNLLTLHPLILGLRVECAPIPYPASSRKSRHLVGGARWNGGAKANNGRPDQLNGFEKKPGRNAGGISKAAFVCCDVRGRVARIMIWEGGAARRSHSGRAEDLSSYVFIRYQINSFSPSSTR